MEDYIRKQKMKRVVITGMGIYSCIGRNQEEVKESLFQGKSGIGIAPARKEMGYFSALTGLVERPDLKKSSFPQLFYPLMTRQFFCDFHEKSEDFCVS